MAVEPLFAVSLVTVSADSTVTQWAGFRPFAPGKDKELVLEVGEKNGGRVLTLVIKPKQILNAKIIKDEKTQTHAKTDPINPYAMQPIGGRCDESSVEEVDLPDL